MAYQEVLVTSRDGSSVGRSTAVGCVDRRDNPPCFQHGQQDTCTRDHTVSSLYKTFINPPFFVNWNDDGICISSHRNWGVWTAVCSPHLTRKKIRLEREQCTRTFPKTTGNSHRPFVKNSDHISSLFSRNFPVVKKTAERFLRPCERNAVF